MNQDYKIKEAKFGDENSVRADWLCIGWPFCQVGLRREFQRGGQFFGSSLYFLIVCYLIASAQASRLFSPCFQVVLHPLGQLNNGDIVVLK